MEVVVLTVDQDGSREGTDQVPAALEALAAVATRLPFERTVGDELQGVLDTRPPSSALSNDSCAPAPGTSVSASVPSRRRSRPARAGRGPAYLAARRP